MSASRLAPSAGAITGPVASRTRRRPSGRSPIAANFRSMVAPPRDPADVADAGRRRQGLDQPGSPSLGHRLAKAGALFRARPALDADFQVARAPAPDPREVLAEALQLHHGRDRRRGLRDGRDRGQRGRGREAEESSASDWLFHRMTIHPRPVGAIGLSSDSRPNRSVRRPTHHGLDLLLAFVQPIGASAEARNTVDLVLDATEAEGLGTRRRRPGQPRAGSRSGSGS